MKSVIRESLTKLTSVAVFLLPWVTMGVYACKWQLDTAFTMAIGALAYATGRLLQEACLIWLSGDIPNIKIMRK